MAVNYIQLHSGSSEEFADRPVKKDKPFIIIEIVTLRRAIDIIPVKILWLINKIKAVFINFSLENCGLELLRANRHQKLRLKSFFC